MEARMSHVVHGADSARNRFAVLAGLVVTLLALAFTAPGAAHAAQQDATAKNHISHPELDWMGSTIKAHEGSHTSSGTVTPMVTQTRGMDVSGYQGNVN